MIYQQVDFAGNPIWVDQATGQIFDHDPNAVAKLPQSFGYDLSPYRQYLQYAGGSGEIAGAITNYENGFASLGQDWLSNPQGIFDIGYSSGGRHSLNPYFSTQNRDAIRDVAQRLGLSTEDADKAALAYAQNQFQTYGIGYTDAVNPALVANDIVKSLFAQAGRPFQDLTPEKRSELAARGVAFQQYNKSTDNDAWKRDTNPIVGMTGVWTEQLQNAWESSTNDGLPSEQALAGADNPWNTWIQNKLRNEDWDPHGNVVALPTEKNYEQAQAQGYDTGAIAIYQQAIQQAAMMYLGSSGVTGDLTSLGTGAVDPAYINYAKDAKDWYGYYKQYENYKAGGELNPGALFNVATAAAGKVGDFDSSAFSGGDSPYNANSFFDGSNYGSNFAGGNVFDENGDWLDGEYDIYGNFVPADQTTFGDDYGAGYGQGNDIFGGGNLEQSNPELFGDSSFSLGSLGNLFSGLGSSVGGLISGAGTPGSTGNNLLALAPILAGIQYARNQGPFDTSRLTGLADRYNPDSMAFQYDRNTEEQRRALTSSLSDRGVMGSSFGNMDITNFNTNRELGRGALISQASLGGADIAQKILQAQIQERQLRNQMYGSSLYALGNVFGGKR